MFITIDGLVNVYNWDVFVRDEALNATPERLFEAVRVAYSQMKDEFYGAFVNHHVYLGQFSGRSEITLEEYLSLKREHEIAQAGRIAKGKHTTVRRKDFGARRSQLALTMLDAGVLHKCAFPGCEEIDDLTVDHIRPLSRGGDDGLSNLQFLCRPHNSAKGDRFDH